MVAVSAPSRSGTSGSEAGQLSTEIVKIEPRELATLRRCSQPPPIVERAGGPAVFAYAEFSEAEFENDNTHRS